MPGVHVPPVPPLPVAFSPHQLFAPLPPTSSSAGLVYHAVAAAAASAPSSPLVGTPRAPLPVQAPAQMVLQQQQQQPMQQQQQPMQSMQQQLNQQQQQPQRQQTADAPRKPSPPSFRPLAPAPTPPTPAVPLEPASHDEAANDDAGDSAAPTPAGTPSTTTTGKRRARATPDQLAILEETFLTHTSPNQQLRQELAQKLGMSERSVQIWFQNKRAKVKLKQRKSLQAQEEALRSQLAMMPPGAMWGHHHHQMGAGASLVGAPNGASPIMPGMVLASPNGAGAMHSPAHLASPLTPSGAFPPDMYHQQRLLAASAMVSSTSALGSLDILGTYLLPIDSLLIGTWRRIAILSTKSLFCAYSLTHRLFTWTISDAGHTFKMEVPFASVTRLVLHAVVPPPAYPPGSQPPTPSDVPAPVQAVELVLHLTQPPTFWMQVETASGKVWTCCRDFTANRQAETHLVHRLRGKADLMRNQVSTILQSDPGLHAVAFVDGALTAPAHTGVELAASMVMGIPPPTMAAAAQPAMTPLTATAPQQQPMPPHMPAPITNGTPAPQPTTMYPSMSSPTPTPGHSTPVTPTLGMAQMTLQDATIENPAEHPALRTLRNRPRRSVSAPTMPQFRMLAHLGPSPLGGLPEVASAMLPPAPPVSDLAMALGPAIVDPRPTVRLMAPPPGNNAAVPSLSPVAAQVRTFTAPHLRGAQNAASANGESGSTPTSPNVARGAPGSALAAAFPTPSAESTPPPAPTAQQTQQAVPMVLDAFPTSSTTTYSAPPRRN
ncbi:hypothetical protein AMAG_17748 [Allomyces macrogynus ATCC 38327]|uniref:Homeobox domain-containing protein n=1 Tax=Allomyces macrogynus (strain ATCC 38327) TaxID=578462 RepID=A0A0L0RYD3_ALLM3|nr:hypothetical protein AMAG_17748 [Allomyces macrogynus ATCC 38327]|eukprot:KNE55165.1 hypothetical protein AMAG_17748 [Allomyces macrogynus ATCC 38327]